MSIGSTHNPLRVAIIGSGPAGFYTLSHLLKAKDLAIRVDMFERLPTPFGLVRAGVAPDHQKDKSVTLAFDKHAEASCFRFFGNVEYGTDLTLAELTRAYHQIVFTTGAPHDRRLGVPGEDAHGSYSATEFVAWYNGHPDYAQATFDLSSERAVVVGMGNVALDVARMLTTPIEQLRRTDMADHALEALAESKVREVVMLGRRGPLQAAFTPAELKELTELAGVGLRVNPQEVTLNGEEARALPFADKPALKNLALLEAIAADDAPPSARSIELRFRVSPVVINTDAQGVCGIELAHNQLQVDADGWVSVQSTDVREPLTTGLVFKSVGYRGKPVDGLPFDEKAGTVANLDGRVIDASGEHLTGLYVSGWVKRGAQGVIGTNKTDAKATVACMLEDLTAGRMLSAAEGAAVNIDNELRDKQLHVVDFPAWRWLDQLEIERGQAQSRPRVKVTEVAAMLAALQARSG